MNDNSRRKWDAFQRMTQFASDNPTDWPVGQPGHAEFTQLGTIISNVDTSAADQAGAAGLIAQCMEYKANSREFLRGKISDMATLARESMVYTFAGIDEVFRMPRNRNDADLLAAARAFHTNSGLGGYEAAFISFGLPVDFRDTLHDAADDFEASMQSVASVLADQSEAIAETIDWILQGMRLRRILIGIAKIKYKNNPGKQAAWHSASHLESATNKEKRRR